VNQGTKFSRQEASKREVSSCLGQTLLFWDDESEISRASSSQGELSQEEVELEFRGLPPLSP